MSSTRRVQEGERRRQNGWASAAEYDVLRGLNGTAVAMKAALEDSNGKRELLYFIQALSLRDGGLKRLARELVEMFPERLGTPTMHKLGCKAGKRLTPEQSKQIWSELRGKLYYDAGIFVDDAELRFARAGRVQTVDCEVKSADSLIHDAQLRATNMDAFLEELCCNPERRIIGGAESFYPSVPYFDDVVGALFKYQCRYSEQFGDNHATTSVSKIVFEALDYALETGRSALIEGASGFGKTTAIKAWHEKHLGQSRYLQLTGMTNRSVFLKRLAAVLGVANGDGYSAERIQARIEEFLQRSKLMLIIDEAQYLWPQGRRITTHPELINWLNTALYNEGVPFALSATKQFTLRRQTVERQSDWSSEQLRRRTRKVFSLPDAPTVKDLQAVAQKLLVGMSEATVDFVAGYALSSRGYFQTITDAIEDAQLIARRAGRDRFTAKDLQVAIKEWRAPSDAALQRVFDSKPEKQRRERVGQPQPGDYESPANEPDEPISRQTRPLQTDCNRVAGRRETQPAVLVPG